MFEEGARLKKIHGAGNVFDFSIGNPDPEPPLEVTASFIKNAGDPAKGTHGYMSNAGYMELREKIAAAEARRSGLDIKASNTVITCGAAGGLNVSLAAIIDPGDEVIILKPFFAEYIFYVQNYAGVPVFVDTDPDTFLPDTGSFEKALSSKTKAVIINSPNNPTGVIYPRDVLNELLANGGPVSAEDLASRLDLTARQVKYDLKGIHQWLTYHEIILEVVPGVGIKLELADQQKQKIQRMLKEQLPWKIQ